MSAATTKRLRFQPRHLKIKEMERWIEICFIPVVKVNGALTNSSDVPHTASLIIHDLLCCTPSSSMNDGQRMTGLCAQFRPCNSSCRLNSLLSSTCKSLSSGILD